MQSWWDRQTLVDFHVARDHIARGENSSLKDSIDGWWLMTHFVSLHLIILSNFNKLKKELWDLTDTGVANDQNHGLRTPRESFFSKISNFWAWADILAEIFWAFGVFSAGLSAPILVLCFSLFNHYFYKKLNFYIQLQNIYWEWDLNLGCK